MLKPNDEDRQIQALLLITSITQKYSDLADILKTEEKDDLKPVLIYWEYFVDKLVNRMNKEQMV